MSTWGSLRFQLQKGAPGIDLDLLDSYLNSRYEQVLEKAEWSGVKQHFTLLTQAAYQSATDTVTATVGSPLIVGLGANFTSQLIGSRFYIPGDAVYYTVSAVADTLDLTLERPYEGRGTDPPGTVYAASPYVFMQHIYLLATDVGTVISLLDPVTGFPLLAMSKAELDASAGPRTLVNDPTSYAMYDDSSETTPPVLHQIELFLRHCTRAAFRWNTSTSRRGSTEDPLQQLRSRGYPIPSCSKAAGPTSPCTGPGRTRNRPPPSLQSPRGTKRNIRKLSPAPCASNTSSAGSKRPLRWRNGSRGTG